jgi:hypothetical protein
MTDAIDVVLTFDTTGSMYPCLTQVRRSIVSLCKTLFDDIPDLRLAIIAHGDYCDKNHPYITKSIDFSSNLSSIVDFVRNVEPTGGGDSPECYELVLYEARIKLKWKSGRSKVIVMIGDDVPHGPTYPQNTLKIDWRNELGLLLEAGINVYGVHAMPGCRNHSKPFYTEIARKTGGCYLTLDQFSSVADLIMAICYKQESPEKFVSFAKTVQSTGRMTKGLMDSFRTLSVGIKIDDVDFGKAFTPPKSYSYMKDGLHPVASGRFQVIHVDSETTIQDFVRNQGLSFQKGGAFYELVRYGKKKYKVQQYKEIILMDRESGDFFNGVQVRAMLNLQPQVKEKGVVESLAPRSLDKYRVFIQSTSYTRVLVPDSSLLYEVEDWGDR